MRAEIFLQGLISCLIVAFGQPSFGPWLSPIAAALGYALFWRAIRIYPFAKQRFWRGAIWFSCVTLIQLSWMSVIDYQGLYMLIVWAVLSAGLGLQFGMLTILIPYNTPLTFPRILAISALWTLLEWSRFFFLCGYSWNLSGLALSNPYSIQFATVFGVLGLSFWVIFSNLLGFRASSRRGVIHYVIWIGAVCFPYFFGAGHLLYHEKQMQKTESKLFSCLLVQTGLLPSEKGFIEGREFAYISPYAQWKRILYLVKDGLGKAPDLIVLPEAVVPLSSDKCVYNQGEVDKIFLEVFGHSNRYTFPPKISPYVDRVTRQVSNAYWIQSLANIFKSEVIIGLDYSDESGTAHCSAFHAMPFKTSFSRYDKQILVPMVEYLPFSFLAPLVKRYGITEFYTHGVEAKIFEGKIPMSTSICYEETFPQNVRQGRLKGAKMLINVTNDGWYPFSLLPSQHYEHARFRAVENGAPLLRACNSGISAAIDSFGRSIGEMEQVSISNNSKNSKREKGKSLQSGALFVEIHPYEYRTLFTIWGNGGIVCICFLILGIFFSLKKEFNW